MAEDIFGKNITVAAGPLGRAETFEVYVGAQGSAANFFLGLAQNLQNSYSQPLTRVYELGNYNTYMVSGRAQGTLQIGRLVGVAHGSALSGKPTLHAVLEGIAGNAFFHVDGSPGGSMRFRDRVTGAEWVATGCYVTQLGVGVDANGILISENVAIEYQKLSITPVPAGVSPVDARSEGPNQGA